jgi:hypothetical protein
MGTIQRADSGAKARVWASEGWEVKITDDEGKELANLPAENEA